MTDIGITGCDLHIPHKEWSGDERERQNYLTMERWANNFRKNCVPPCAEEAPPEEPYFPPGTAVHILILMDTSQTFPATRTLVRGNVAPLGAVTGGPAIAETDGAGHIIAFSVPPGTYNPITTGGISASMNFSEGGASSGAVSRTLELELRRASDNTLFNTYSVTQSGDRSYTVVTVSVPNITLTERMIVRTYATFGSLTVANGILGGGTGNAFGADGVHA